MFEFRGSSSHAFWTSEHIARTNRKQLTGFGKILVTRVSRSIKFHSCIKLKTASHYARASHRSDLLFWFDTKPQSVKT
jgi:hypothetical protein